VSWPRWPGWRLRRDAEAGPWPCACRGARPWRRPRPGPRLSAPVGARAAGPKSLSDRKATVGHVVEVPAVMRWRAAGDPSPPNRLEDLGRSARWRGADGIGRRPRTDPWPRKWAMMSEPSWTVRPVIGLEGDGDDPAAGLGDDLRAEPGSRRPARFSKRYAAA